MPALQTAPYDGVAEIWFEDLAGAAAMFTSDHYNTIVAKDEKNFLDRSKTVSLFAKEATIVDSTPLSVSPRARASPA